MSAARPLSPPSHPAAGRAFPPSSTSASLPPARRGADRISGSTLSKKWGALPGLNHHNEQKRVAWRNVADFAGVEVDVEVLSVAARRKPVRPRIAVYSRSSPDLPSGARADAGPRGRRNPMHLSGPSAGPRWHADDSALRAAVEPRDADQLGLIRIEPSPLRSTSGGPPPLRAPTTVPRPKRPEIWTGRSSWIPPSPV